MVEKLKFESPGDKPPDDNEAKEKALEDAVESERIYPISFLGKRYYTKEYIDRANRELSNKLSTEHGIGDKESQLAEWEFTYALGHGETLPGCRARLASEYDDHINGIDIVCKQKSLVDGQPYVFGVDVCTATLPRAVDQKFARGDFARGDVPAGCSWVKFYKDGDFVACMKGVPRFVLGASPLFVSHQKYLKNFHLEDDGSVSHSPDPDLQFNILSSLFLQSAALEKRLKKSTVGNEDVRERAINTCIAVNLASAKGLCRLLGTNEIEDFTKKVSAGVDKAQNLRVNGYKDDCYARVINESLKRQDPNYVTPSNH